MAMTPRLRKFALAPHVMFSIGWIGAVAAYIALDLAAATSQDVQTLRAAYPAMELITWRAIVPLAFASLLTGLLLSLGRRSFRWGGGRLSPLLPHVDCTRLRRQGRQAASETSTAHSSRAATERLDRGTSYPLIGPGKLWE